jgi:BarA-like signal transduction histidine kinase
MEIALVTESVEVAHAKAIAHRPGALTDFTLLRIADCFTGGSAELA